MPREGKKPPSSQALALLYLRSKRGWSQKDLAARIGLADYKQISRYETGEKPLSPRKLNEFAGSLGYPPEAVEALQFIDTWIEPEAMEEPFSPVSLPPEVQRSIHRSGLTLTWSLLDAWQEEIPRAVRDEMVKMARRKAQELWARLKSATRQERREAVAALPELQDWALAELVCHESEKAAAHKVEMALELADLALFIARRVPGDTGWRSQLEGYCWAYIGNVRRVANDFAGADAAFARSSTLWQSGATSDPSILAEWRLLDLEASLRRAQHRFPEALELLDKAMSLREASVTVAARILLKKEHVLSQTGDIEGALSTLIEAASYVEACADPRLLFAFHFNLADNLCRLGQYQNAADKLPQVRDLAVQQGRDLDLVRVVWLESKVAAGQGRRDAALAGLNQVREDFTVRGLPYDAALASLELAVLYLEEGHTAEVRNLARALGWIFQAQGIPREALAALNLFLEAAQRESATVELVTRVAADLRRIRATAPPQNRAERGRA